MSSFESVNQWVVRTHRRLAGHADQYPEHERLQVVALTYLGLFAGLSVRFTIIGNTRVQGHG